MSYNWFSCTCFWGSLIYFLKETSSPSTSSLIPSPTLLCLAYRISIIPLNLQFASSSAVRVFIHVHVFHLLENSLQLGFRWIFCPSILCRSWHHQIIPETFRIFRCEGFLEGNAYSYLLDPSSHAGWMISYFYPTMSDEYFINIVWIN